MMHFSKQRTAQSVQQTAIYQAVCCSLLAVCFALPLHSAPTASGPKDGRAVPDDMEVQIKGQFKGRFAVKKIAAPVTMNLEKLQDFPEDPSQKIMLGALPISLGTEFNYRSEVKGHSPFVPWIPALPEPPFLRMTPPKLEKDQKIESWMFEVFNPQGQTIYRQRGTNQLPDELIWEGKDSEKKYAVVDRLYSAQMTLVAPEGKATVIQGNSVILPAMIYGSDQSETVEFSLDRIFDANKAEISAEGRILMSKLGERLRERGLTKMFVRVAGKNAGLSAERESVLVEALEKSLLLAPGQIEHDNTRPTLRGEIVSVWLKKSAGGR